MAPLPPVADRPSADRLTLDAIIPTLDEQSRIGALVERLLRRGSGSADRVDRAIVVDGGSRDRTAELAARAGAEVLRTAPSRGLQLAHGAQAAGAEVLVFLHADAWPEDGSIERVRRAAAERGLVVGAFHQRIDAPGWFYRAVEWSADRRVAWRGMVYGDSGLVVRRGLYLRAGGFRPIPLFEDVELSRWLRRFARPELIRGADLRISPRRWRAEGALRATLRNWMLRAAFEAGASPQSLLRFYRADGAREST